MKRITVRRIEDVSDLGLVQAEDDIKAYYSTRNMVLLHTLSTLPWKILTAPNPVIHRRIQETKGAKVIQDLAVKRFVVSYFKPGDRFFIDWITLEAEMKHDEPPHEGILRWFDAQARKMINVRVQEFAKKFAPFGKWLVKPEIYIAKERVVNCLPAHVKAETMVSLISEVIPCSSVMKLGDISFELVTEGHYKKTSSYVDKSSYEKSKEYEDWVKSYQLGM